MSEVVIVDGKIENCWLIEKFFLYFLKKKRCYFILISFPIKLPSQSILKQLQLVDFSSFSVEFFTYSSILFAKQWKDFDFDFINLVKPIDNIELNKIYANDSRSKLF